MLEIFANLASVVAFGVSTLLVVWQLWVNIISKSRIEWIVDMRNDVATILSPSELLDCKIESAGNISVDFMHTLGRAKYRLLSRLNSTSGPLYQSYQDLSELLSLFSIRSMGRNSSVWRANVLALSKQILDYEWARVKHEAKWGGKK